MHPILCMKLGSCAKLITSCLSSQNYTVELKFKFSCQTYKCTCCFTYCMTPHHYLIPVTPRYQIISISGSCLWHPFSLCTVLPKNMSTVLWKDIIQFHLIPPTISVTKVTSTVSSHTLTYIQQYSISSSTFMSVSCVPEVKGNTS